jgi:hypothetical protein
MNKVQNSSNVKCNAFLHSSLATVKQILELNNNLLTQCIKMKTALKLNPATVLNILLKINAKTNGINHSIHTRNR